MNETTHNVVPAPFDTLHAAQTFAQPEIVSTLSAKLSWSHFVNLLPHQTEPARQFYASRANRRPSASSCAPNPAANRWSCCKCTKTASLWPNTGPNCHPKRSWSKNCMQRCLKRASGWRGAGCCPGTWMLSDDMKVSKGLGFPVVALPSVGHMPAKGEDEQEAARVFYVAATRATRKLVIEVRGDGGLGGGYRSSVSVLQRTVTSDAKRSSSLPRRCLKVHIQHTFKS